MKTTKRIDSIKVDRITDDLQHENAEDSIGTFDNVAKTEYAIELDSPCYGYRYEGFKFYNGPVENYKGIEPEEIRKYVAQDYKRMQSFNAGDWEYIGIRATAKVVIAGVCQTVKSAGLWGIESDSGEDYLREIEQEQLAELQTILQEMGFANVEIAEKVPA